MLDILGLIYRIFSDIITFFTTFEIVQGLSILSILIILSLYGLVFHFLKK